MIFVMGVTMLKLDRAKAKWRVKLQRAFSGQRMFFLPSSLCLYPYGHLQCQMSTAAQEPASGCSLSFPSSLSCAKVSV